MNDFFSFPYPKLTYGYYYYYFLSIPFTIVQGGWVKTIHSYIFRVKSGSPKPSSLVSPFHACVFMTRRKMLESAFFSVDTFSSTIFLCNDFHIPFRYFGCFLYLNCISPFVFYFRLNGGRTLYVNTVHHFCLAVFPHNIPHYYFLCYCGEW